MKKLLEDKDVVLADLKKKSKADALKLADIEKLKAENEQMKNERDEWAKKLHSISKRGNALESFVKDFLAKMLESLIGMFPLPSVSLHFLSTDTQLIFCWSFAVELCPDFEKETFEVDP